jgi:hypothetical protein
MSLPELIATIARDAPVSRLVGRVRLLVRVASRPGWTVVLCRRGPAEGVHALLRACGGCSHRDSRDDPLAGPFAAQVSVPAARLEWQAELRETAATRFIDLGPASSARFGRRESGSMGPLALGGAVGWRFYGGDCSIRPWEPEVRLEAMHSLTMEPIPWFRLHP